MAALPSHSGFKYYFLYLNEPESPTHQSGQCTCLISQAKLQASELVFLAEECDLVGGGAKGIEQGYRKGLIFISSSKGFLVSVHSHTDTFPPPNLQLATADAQTEQ